MVETDLFCKAREMVPKTKEIGKARGSFRERERRDSGQSKGDGTGDKRKREKLAKEKENMMVDCWVFIYMYRPRGPNIHNRGLT